MGKHEISVQDEDTMKALYSHRQNTPKSWWYNVWIIPGAAQGFFAIRDRKLHGFLRKRVSHMFSVTSLVTMETYIQSCMDVFMSKMSQFEAQGKTVEIGNWTNALAFDVIGELGYGPMFGHMATESDVLNLRGDILSGFKIFSRIGYLWGQWRLVLNPLVAALGPPPATTFADYTARQLQARKADRSGRRADLLEHWLNMKRADNTPAHDDEIIAEMFSVIGGGGDTTSILMRACLFYVATSPKVYATLRKEIDDFCGDREPDRQIMYKETQTLPYLQAVIKESARLWPSISVGGLTIDGKFYVPEGYSVSISPMAQNRDPCIYGDDAKEFRPERWLQNEIQTRRMELLSMTFGGNGPRACLGTNLALMEVQLLITRFIRGFDYEIVNKEHPWRVCSAWFASQNEMYIRLTRRGFDSAK
ncbi:cytochrome P450 [Exophiala viscosa]|uniref:Cytochrome P450 n=1 Tax=Exophiala viscosa TaxID=2486360 RepID=A0AAN6DTK9_9EURO|nr:cytochrome P450 [Exophiala viscosa]